MANTSVLGISLPLAPVTMVFGSAISYWIFLVGGLAGTAYACYHVFSRHVVRSRVAAWLGGATIGFAPGIIHHANGQPNFSTHFLVPFLVLVAVRLGRPGRTVRDGLILAGLVTWQFFINQEVLLITAVAAAVITVVRIRDVWRDWPRILGSLGIAAVVAGALLAYPMWFQFRGPQSYRGLPFEFHSWGEDLAAYVTFARDTLAGDGYVEKAIGDTEQNTWFGWPLVLVVIVAAVLLWRRSKPARVATITGIVFVIVGIGPEVVIGGKGRGIPGPWSLISSGHVPVLELLQPTRLTLVVVGVVGLMVALAWDALRDVRGAAPAGDRNLRDRDGAGADHAVDHADDGGAEGARLHHRRPLAGLHPAGLHGAADPGAEQRRRHLDAALQRRRPAGVPDPARVLHRPGRERPRLVRPGVPADHVLGEPRRQVRHRSTGAPTA